VVVLLGEHRVGRAPPGQLTAQQVVRRTVAGRLELLRVGVPHLVAHLEQHLPGAVREPARERGVDDRRQTAVGQRLALSGNARRHLGLAHLERSSSSLRQHCPGPL
jgi:hypothetical protein